MLTPGKSLTYSFPPILDPDLDDTWKLSKLELADASGFVTETFPLLTLNPVADTPAKTYSISVTLTDDNPTPQLASYTLLVTV